MKVGKTTCCGSESPSIRLIDTLCLVIKKIIHLSQWLHDLIDMLCRHCLIGGKWVMEPMMASIVKWLCLKSCRVVLVFACSSRDASMDRLRCRCGLCGPTRASPYPTVCSLQVFVHPIVTDCMLVTMSTWTPSCCSERLLTDTTVRAHGPRLRLGIGPRVVAVDRLVQFAAEAYTFVTLS